MMAGATLSTGRDISYRKKHLNKHGKTLKRRVDLFIIALALFSTIYIYTQGGPKVTLP